MNICQALVCAVLALPLACTAQSGPTSSEALKLTDFAIVAVHPRLLVISVRCGRADTPPGTRAVAVVRDHEGLPQSQGFTFQACNGQPAQILLDIPDGTGTLQNSQVLFDVSTPAGVTVYHQAFAIPPQAAVALPAPNEMQKAMAGLRGPDPGYLAAFGKDFELSDFDAVDRLFDRLDHDDVKLASGRSANETYLDALWEKLAGPERVLWSQRFAKWHHDAPASNAALIATAEAIRDDAWGLRGGAIDSKLDADARKLFNRRLAEADRLLLPQLRGSRSSAISDEILIEIMREEKKPAAQLDKVGAEAIARFPRHTELYITLADPNTMFTRRFDQSRQPLEDVDWAHAEQLMRIARSENAASETYALFYDTMFSRQAIEFRPFVDSFVNWPDMKISFDALLKAYPAAENMNLYAAYACRARDWQSYRMLRRQLDAQSLQPDKWPSNGQPQVCDAAANS